MSKLLLKIRNAVGSAAGFIGDRKWFLAKLAGYAAVLAVFYGMFLWLLFPYNELMAMVSERIKDTTSMDVSVRKAGGAFPLGLKLEDVVITEKAGTVESPVLEARTIELVPGILSLFRGRLAVKVYASLYNGAVWMDAWDRGSTFDLSGEIRDVDVGRYSLIKSRYGLHIEGALSAKFDVEGDRDNVTKDTGKVDITMKHARLDPSSLFGIFALPGMDFGTIDLPVFIHKGRVVFQDATQTGKDMNSKLSGMIVLVNQIDDSVLNLKLSFNPTPALEQRIRKAMPIFTLNRDTTGYFNLPVTGTLHRPRLAL